MTPRFARPITSALRYMCVLSGTLMIWGALAGTAGAQEIRGLIFDRMALDEAPDFPVPEPEPANSEEELQTYLAEYQTSVERLRSERPGSDALAAELGMLAQVYQALERHEEAIGVIQEALQITVENHGPNSLEQVSLQEQLIANHLALNDIAAVDDRQEFIYSLYQANYRQNEAEMVEATLALADWLTVAYYKENYFPDGDGLRIIRNTRDRTQRNIMGAADEEDEAATAASGGSGMDETMRAIFNGDIRDLNNMDLVDARLRRIDRLYRELQENYYNSDNVEITTVLGIARRVARLAFVHKQEMDFERNNNIINSAYNGSRVEEARNSQQRLDESYRSGRDALQSVVNILRSAEVDDPSYLAQALLDLADWQLAYGEVNSAEQSYAEAYRVLTDFGYPVENVDAALAVDNPPRIPLIATHVYSRGSHGLGSEANLDYKGYIDVTYTIDRLGNPEEIAFTGSGGELANQVESVLSSQLRSAKFRPTLRGGDMVAPGEFSYRYFYTFR